MLSDKELIQLMVHEPSWEDVIVKIVAEEGMDPWNIDIVHLAEVFASYLDSIKETDLRIPARFILITAILLRMKSDILSAKGEKILLAESEKPENPLLRVLANIPPLQPPMKRIPLANVTLKELITALRKAFEVQERRKKRKQRRFKAVHHAVMPETEEDITERIENLLEQIHGAIKDIEGSVEFAKLLKEWDRENIVKALSPVLHLSQEGKIKINQEELFKEITIELTDKGKKEKKE